MNSLCSGLLDVYEAGAGGGADVVVGGFCRGSTASTMALIVFRQRLTASRL